MKKTRESLTVVIKLGSSSILSPDTLLPNLSTLSAIAETCLILLKEGHKVVIVSSGAIAMGMKRMGKKEKGKGIPEKQALAAIGQGRLIALWDNLFSQLDQPIAQVLLTRNDISDHSRFMNARSTLLTLLSQGVIPIVNENDTISVSEIKFGDNDTLSAIAAALVSADWLFLCTDVECLWMENPRRAPEGRAKQVLQVRDIEEVRRIVSTSTLGSSLGTGGMETKLIAAELATAAGVSTVITLGSQPSRIISIIASYTSSPTNTSRPATAEPVVLGPLSSSSTIPLHTRFHALP
ncbi:glutamate 5-kinase, partial [Atractiella rhizophila]